MPISVDYAPPAESVFNAAMVGGWGEYQARQNQQRLQAQQLALQDQHFQQQLAAHLYQQQQQQLANQNSQLFHAGQQRYLQDSQQQNHADRAAWDRQNQLDDQTTRRDWQNEDWTKQITQADAAREDQQRFAQSQFEDQQRALWERNSVEQGEKGIDDQISHVANNMDLLPEGDRSKFQTLYNNWTAIRADRAIAANPKAYGEVLQKFAGDFQRSGIVERMKPRLNTAQQFQEETFAMPGVGVVGRDRSGAWRNIADDPIHSFVAKILPQLQKQFIDEDTGEVDQGKLNKALASSVAAYRSTLSGQPAQEPQPPQPTPQQLADSQRARAQYESRQRAEAEKGIVGWRGNEPVFAGQDGQVRPVSTQRDEPAMPSNHISEVPPERREVLSRLLPHPKTPAEAAKLPAGTTFVTPDGRLKVVGPQTP